MCTLTLVREGPRLLLTMNRDDAAARAEAPPSLQRRDGVRLIAPVDLQAGGTWIGVNEYGVAACLLNRYDAAPAGHVSRGGIVFEALRASSAALAAARLASLAHSDFSPHTCIIVSARAAIRCDWDGVRFNQVHLEHKGPWMMTSSSWRLEYVRLQRQNLFSIYWQTAVFPTQPLAAFHCQRDPARDVWAPMMLRKTAQTKSVTQIELGADCAKMLYWRRSSAIARGLDRADETLLIDISGAACESATPQAAYAV